VEAVGPIPFSVTSSEFVGLPSGLHQVEILSL